MNERTLMLSATRSKAVFDRWAAYVDHDHRIVTTEGGAYRDTLCGLGANVLSRGRGVCSLPYYLEQEAADVVLRDVAPWASTVRFVKTGSESTEAAYRIAKKATGASHVLIGDWAYHGQFEWCSDLTFPFVHRYKHGHDFLTTRQWYHAADEGTTPHDEIAAVLIEPHRWEPVDVEWLRSVRAYCDQVGALLVFDSMIYGGRMALGGASEYFGVTPDLECFGKALGNGEAIAFVVGKDALAEHGEMISGTFSGDATGLRALLNTLKVYREGPVIETLWARGRQLQVGLDALVPQYPTVVTGRSGLPVHQRLDFVSPEMGIRFMHEMLNHGVLWHPACVNVNYQDTEADIAAVLEAVRGSLGYLS